MKGELHLPEGELDAFVDGELDAADRARAVSHIAACESCRGEVEELRWLRAQLRPSGAEATPPDAAFGARIRAALDREDVQRARAPGARRTRARTWLGVGLAAAATAAALNVWLAAPKPFELPSEIAARTLAAASTTREPIGAAALEARFAVAHLPFAARVLDLQMMGWQIASGALTSIGEHASTQIVYRDAGGRSLLCFMLAAGVDEFPADGERFSEGGITFFLFTRGEVTVVAWAEGEVLCLLSGALPASEVRALAVAKAMLPARRS